MESPNPLKVAILLCLVALVSSGSISVQVGNVEEREIMTRKQVDAYLASKDSLAGPIMDLAKSSMSGLNTLSRVNYSQPIGQVVWDVAEAVVPIIGAALALIPGVGVIVSGVFLGLWSLISPIFAPKKDNPLEKMINELAKQMSREIDDKLSSVINRAIYGEITRNNYICSKYTFISQDFTEDLKHRKALREIDALKLMIYLDNCDNFLKDTSEAFVYDEYADLLWIPGAIATTTRLGFLTELFRHGESLGMKRNVTAMYLQELKKDIRKQFLFLNAGFKVAHKNDRKKKLNYDSKDNYLENVGQIEKSACQMQGQFLYFDPDLYPYGIPKVFNKTDMFGNVSLDQHYNENTDGTVKHFQMFFDVTKSTYDTNLPKNGNGHHVLELMNCFLGPMSLTAPSTFWFKFSTPPSKNYSYEFRVFYLLMERTSQVGYVAGVPVLTEFNKRSQKFFKYLDVHRNLYSNEHPRGQTNLNIEFVHPTDIDTKDKAKNSKKLVDVPGWARWKTCPFTNDPAYCNTGNRFFYGDFKMYSAGTFNHNNETLSPIIVIDEPLQFHSSTGTPTPSGFLLGMEIVLRPRI